MHDDYKERNLSLPKMSYFEWLVGILAANCELRTFNNPENMVKYCIKSAKIIIKELEKQERKSKSCVKAPLESVAEYQAKFSTIELEAMQHLEQLIIQQRQR